MSRQLALRLAELAGGAVPLLSRLFGRWGSWWPTSGSSVSRWPRRLPPPVTVEPPAWVRACDPDQWRDDQADAAMLGGLLENGLDERYDSARDWHATNRWNKARLAWFAVHPEAKHPVEELLEGRPGPAPIG